MAKLYAPHLNGLTIAGEEIEKAEDGSFDVPAEHVAECVEVFGMTSESPAGAKILTPVAPVSGNPAQWKAEVLQAEAKRLGIDPDQPRAELLKAVAGARKEEAEAADKQARIAELEAKPAEELTPEEAEELAALKAEE